MLASRWFELERWPGCWREGDRPSYGFTLIEFLIASTITVVTTSTLLVGLHLLLSADRETSNQARTHLELNRSLDFIADEFRAAGSVATPTTSPAATCPLPCTPVLDFQVPISGGGNARIQYYLVSAGANELGPNAIVRQGPSFNIDGTYDTGTIVSQTLVDGIASGVAASSGDCANGAAEVLGTTQFYACIDTSPSTIAGVAEVHIRIDGNDVQATVATRL